MHQRFTSLEGYSERELRELENSRVGVVGLGATGSVIAEHLARHGFELVIIDRDYLEEKDLYTSNIYTTGQAEKSLPKARAGEETLGELTEVESHVDSLNSGNVSLLDGVDLIMDGTDNLETRFLLNEYSKRENVPWIYTAAVGEKAYSMLFQENCFSCIFEEVEAGRLETCESAGIMRETASIAASVSALKAVRLLGGENADERLEIIPSGERMGVESSGCAVCQGKNYPHLDSNSPVSAVCGENKFQLERDISDKAFTRLKEHGTLVAENDYLLRVRIGGKNFTLFRDGRAIIEARDRGQAEELFAEVLGI